MFAAYIILGIALIGREIENPFGDDVNDLPLDAYCLQIQRDIDIILSKPAPSLDDFLMNDHNMLLHPLSHLGSKAWEGKSVEEIREALRAKPDLALKQDHQNESGRVNAVHSRHGSHGGHASHGEHQV
jgi:putative membrane protein